MLRLPERVHKGPFIVTTAVLGSFLLVAGIILLVLGVFGNGKDLMRVYVSSENTGSSVSGVGINLNNLPTANLISNASFENVQYDQVYIVSEGTADAIYVSSDSQTSMEYEDRFFVGGSIRVTSLDENGKLVQKLSSVVTDYQSNQFGIWTLMEPASGTYEEQVVLDITSSSTLTVAVGSDGYLVSDMTSASPKLINTNTTGSFVSVSCVSDRFFAVTDAGEFMTSSDGITWTQFSPDETISCAMNTVTSVNKAGVAAGDKGCILLCSDGQVMKVNSGVTDDLLTSVSSGEELLIAGRNGTVLTSSNGIAFRSLGQDELPVFDTIPNWMCSYYADGVFLLGGDAGQIAYGSYSADTGKYSFTSKILKDGNGLQVSISDTTILSSGEWIVLSETGEMFCSKDQGENWTALENDVMSGIDVIGIAASGKIILSQGISSYTTQLYTRIQFEDAQSENIFEAGDMCYLSYSGSSTDVSLSDEAVPVWQCFGDKSSISASSSSTASAGETSLCLSGEESTDGDNAHYISQVIGTDGDSPFESKQFYRIDIWLKQEGVDNGEVMTWISGDFTSIGTTFSDVGNGWRQYTYTFVLSSDACSNHAGEIRINIGFYGAGKVYIDKMYLGQDDYSDSSLPKAFTDNIVESSPAIIRLNNLTIGDLGASPDAWLLSSGNQAIFNGTDGFAYSGDQSLESSLDLVKKAGAAPWLVIGSNASQKTIDQLMGYMCGSITDPYGKMRVDNGTAVAWSTQFDRLYIEISDPEGIFTTDIQRGAYVDYCIEMIQSSDYYLDIMDKVIFLDGMNYQNGSMQSSADYHTSDLLISNLSAESQASTELSFADSVSTGYTNYWDQIPRVLTLSQDVAGEWIRSANVSIYGDTTVVTADNPNEREISAAEYVESLLHDMGVHSGVVLANIDVNGNPQYVESNLMFSDPLSDQDDLDISAQNNQTLLSIINILDGAVSGNWTEVELLSPSSSEIASEDGATSSDTVFDGLSTYAYSADDGVHVIIANTSDRSALFLLETDLDLKDTYVYQYSDNGLLLNKTKLGQRGNRINLLSGQVAVAIIPN